MYYILKVKIYEGDKEYLLFNSEEELKQFLTEYIILNNYNMCNLYDNTENEISTKIYKHEVLNVKFNKSKYFDDYKCVNNDYEDIFKNSWTKVGFNFNYKINIDLNFMGEIKDKAKDKRKDRKDKAKSKFDIIFKNMDED